MSQRRQRYNKKKKNGEKTIKRKKNEVKIIYISK